MIFNKNPSNICTVTDGVIIHGCNAQGVMGSGVAKQLRAKYPEIFPSYLEFIQEHKKEDISPLGGVDYVWVANNLVVANAITQEYYGRSGDVYVSYIAMKACFVEIAKAAQPYHHHIHIPYLIGAGLGGGNPELIMRIIETKFAEHTVHLHHWK